MSANFWVPASRVPNKQAIMAAATFTYLDKEGNEVVHRLCHEVGEYLVLAKHLFTDWSQHIPEWVEPDIQFATVDYQDNITPRDESQALAWDALGKAECGVLNLACGKGKTVLALKKVAQLSCPALIVVNLLGLISQWKEEAMDHLGLSEDQIGIVQGTKKQWDRPFVIAMINTLGNVAEDLPEETKQKFGVVIWDEVHHLSAPTFLRTAGVFYGKRYGLSATPEREDGLEPIYKAHVGEIFYTDLVGELESEVIFKQLPTRMDLDDPEVAQQVLDRSQSVHIKKLYRYLSLLPNRNKLILQDVKKYLKEGRKIMALTGAALHPNELKALTEKDPAFKGYKIGAVNGTVKGDTRVDIIRDNDVTFATYDTAAEALDAPALDTLLCLTPFKAWRYFQQGKGRIERSYDGKKDPVTVIYEDRFIGNAMGMLVKLKRRIRENGFTYTELKTTNRRTYRKT